MMVGPVVLMVRPAAVLSVDCLVVVLLLRAATEPERAVARRERSVQAAEPAGKETGERVWAATVRAAVIGVQSRSAVHSG